MVKILYIYIYTHTHIYRIVDLHLFVNEDLTLNYMPNYATKGN